MADAETTHRPCERCRIEHPLRKQGKSQGMCQCLCHYTKEELAQEREKREREFSLHLLDERRGERGSR